jgi:hypothetical protein
MSAFGLDVTIPDTLADNDYGNPNGPDFEWNEVEAGAASGDQWDFRGFNVVEVTQGVTYTLTTFGGYDFDNGAVGNGRAGGVSVTKDLILGDIFLDLDGDALWGATAPTFGTGLGGNPAASNANWKWDAVIHFDPADLDTNSGSIDYTVRTLTEDASTQLLRTTDYSGTFNDKAGPWRWESGGVQIDSGTATVVNYAADAIDGSGEAGNKLTLTVDGAFLAYILANQTAATLLHLTQECGNDLLMGRPPVFGTPVTPTPDNGVTLAMLGGGLAGLALLRRRLR